MIKIKAICTALMLSTAAVMGMSFSAQAANASNLSVEFRFGGHHAHPFHQFHFNKPHYGPRHAHPQSSMPRHFEPHRPHGLTSVCRPRHALKTARRYFHMRHADITKMTKRRIIVQGVRHGQRVKLVFANERGCPVMAHQVRW